MEQPLSCQGRLSLARIIQAGIIGPALLCLAEMILAADVRRDGIASKYPGDRGIERDRRVVYHEGFEDSDREHLRKNWETVSDLGRMSFTNDVPRGSGGTNALVMLHVGGGSNGPQLYRRLQPGYEQLFARFYVKMDPACVPIHHFGTCLGGNFPATPWPMVKAGQPPAGDASFWVGIEPFGERWVWDYYTYWWEMRGSPPRGQTWGNSFIRDDTLKVRRGEWSCIETMVRLNKVGESDGELALWIDGRPVSHLGKGFPKGRWDYDKFVPGGDGEGVRWNLKSGAPERFPVPPGGAPFEGFRWRTKEELKLNFVWLYLYITKAPEGHASQVTFDDVVVATEYIGPLEK